MNNQTKKLFSYTLLGFILIFLLGKLLGIDLLYLPQKHAIRALENVFPTCSHACGWNSCKVQKCSCHGVEVVLYNDLPVDGNMKSVCVGEIFETE